MRIAIGIATVGRPQVLAALLADLAGQSRSADRVVVCAPTPGDIAGAEGRENVDFLVGPRGLTRQRNAILDACDEDVLVFFDDDFFPASSYLAAVERIFSENAGIAMVTGSVVADGIIGPGLSVEDARGLLSRLGQSPETLQEIANGYGCNMAVRLATVAAARCRFDERLPLYGWLEDVDFSLRLAAFGRIVKAGSAQGVHLGIKGGRQSGVRLGYSQIANPIYLARKGTCPWRRALRTMSRNIAANCLRTPAPEPYIDRFGRLMGNATALKDLCVGRLDPERILDL